MDVTRRALPILALLALAACAAADGGDQAGPDVPPSGVDATVDGAADGVADGGDAAPRGAVEVVDPGPPLLSGGLPAEAAVDETDRRVVDLAGDWAFRFDDEDVGLAAGWAGEEHDRTAWDTLPVPGAWDLAHPDGFDRQTVGWYATTFTGPEVPAHGAPPFWRLRFAGVFREARVWLNGEELGGFDLPYLPFAFAVSGVLRPGAANTLVVRIDNRLDRQTLPCDTTFNPGRHGWFPYGGITRPVSLEASLPTHVQRVRVRTTTDGEVTAAVRLQRGGGAARLSARLLGPDGAPALVWDTVDLASETEALALTGRVAGPALWSPETPGARYRLAVTVAKDYATERVAWDVAFRRFEARDGRFFLNGEDRWLRGMNRHEDHPDRGPVYDADLVAADLALLADLHVDFCRPGHYPNDVRVLRALEAAGVMIAEEIPVYQLDGEQLADPVLRDRAVRSLERMIVRDGNRPGVVMWSIANEVWGWLPPAEAFARALHDRARELDPDRPTMHALVTVPVASEQDRISAIVDAVGINEYWGWYVGETGDVADYLAAIHAAFPDRTLFVSEYGAGALAGRHAEPPFAEEPLDAHSYSEEWQAWFHERHQAQFAALPFIRGAMPWVFADFRMQWTPTTGDPHPADRMNLKGLVSDDRSARKAAFATIAARYAERAAEAAKRRPAP